MRKLSIHFALSLLFSLMGLRHAVAANTPYNGPVLVLRFINQSDIPLEILDVARAHVERIYGAAGIPILWVADYDNLDVPESRFLQLTVVLSGKDLCKSMCRDKAVTGMAFSNDGIGSRRAFVFSDRVIAEAEKAIPSARSLNRPNALALVAGHVIAHEVGHMLLPSGAHSSTGIMRGRFSRGEVDDAVRRDLLFTPDQGSTIRDVLMREAREF